MNKILTRIITNFVFVFTLLSYFLICTYQHSTDQSLFKVECKKIETHESVWQRQPYGDLMAYCTFLIENLFKKGLHENILAIPVENRTKPEFFMTYDTDLSSTYLFPVKIKEDNNYDFYLDETTFKKLIKLPIIKRSYNKNWNKEYYPRQYYLIQGLEAKDYKKWAIYAFITDKEVNIFTLPMDWEGLRR